MKKRFLYLVFLISATMYPLSSEDSELLKNYRGITFYPTSNEQVKNMTISVPKIAKRIDTIHAKSNYPMSFFKADCDQSYSMYSSFIKAFK